MFFKFYTAHRQWGFSQKVLVPSRGCDIEIKELVMAGFGDFGVEPRKVLAIYVCQCCGAQFENILYTSGSDTALLSAGRAADIAVALQNDSMDLTWTKWLEGAKLSKNLFSHFTRHNCGTHSPIRNDKYGVAKLVGFRDER